MVALDARTILQVNFIYSLTVNFFIVFLVLIQRVKLPSFMEWSIGVSLFTANFFVLSLNLVIPASVSGTLPHILTFLGFVLVKRGIVKFLKIENHNILDILVCLFGSFLVLYNHSAANLKLYLVVIIQTIIVLDTIFLLVKKNKVEKEKRKSISRAFSIIVLIQGIRLIMGMDWQIETNPLDSGNSLSFISMLFFVIYIIITLSIIAIILRKNSDDQKLLIAELERASLYDLLTGVYNRRGFHQMFDYEFKVKKRENNHSGYIMAICDIDFFKRINDQYGHDAGDYILKETSNIFTRLIRETDIVARWGGEEFLFYLPNTDINGGEKILNKIRCSIESNVYNYKKHAITITISFGGVFTTDAIHEFDTLLKMADNKLYEAKNKGRNQVGLTVDPAAISK